MKANENVKFAVMAGEIMLISGAEAFRVEDTIYRILKKFDYKFIETFTTHTGIFVSIEDEEGELVTVVLRIHRRTINLQKIAKVNDVSRKFVEGKITIEEAKNSLKEIKELLAYPNKIFIFGWACSCLGFAFVINNSFKDAIVAFVVGIIAALFNLRMSSRNASNVVNNFSTSAVLSMLSIIFFKLGFGDNMDNIIIGGIMPLVPGVASVNAIRDMLSGDYLSAAARLLDVLLVSVCIALGVGFSLKIAMTFLGGI